MNIVCIYCDIKLKKTLIDLKNPVIESKFIGHAF